MNPLQTVPLRIQSQEENSAMWPQLSDLRNF